MLPLLLTAECPYLSDHNHSSRRRRRRVLLASIHYGIPNQQYVQYVYIFFFFLASIHKMPSKQKTNKANPTQPKLERRIQTAKRKYCRRGAKEERKWIMTMLAALLLAIQQQLSLQYFLYIINCGIFLYFLR